MANNPKRMSSGFTSSTHPNQHPSLSSLESTGDLATLQAQSLTDDTLVSCLRERFMTDHIYTALGTNSLVVVNPHKYVGVNSDSVLYKYSAEYADLGLWDSLLAGEGTAEAKKTLPPHIFQLANNAYYHMRRTGQDQCIVFT
jgi:chitin synthase